MKQDLLDALSGCTPSKIPSKETLEHPGLITHVSGVDVYGDTRRALTLAWERLGIDIHAAPPRENASPPPDHDATWVADGQRRARYGINPSYMPLAQLETGGRWDLEQVWSHDVAQDAAACELAASQEAIESQRFVDAFGDRAVRYGLYFTTLLSWAVVTFGWEPFFLAIGSDPERFEEQFWGPWAAVSWRRFEALSRLPDEVLFCHDHLAMATGPVLKPADLERYILSRYEWIMAPALEAGKRIILVCDGKLDDMLERLLELPFAGLLVDSPATSFQRVLDTWGRAGRGFSGGIETDLLTRGTPGQVIAHTRDVIERGRAYPGFILSASGQLPANIPLENLLAYFRTRDALGCPAIC